MSLRPSQIATGSYSKEEARLITDSNQTYYPTMLNFRIDSHQKIIRFQNARVYALWRLCALRVYTSIYLLAQKLLVSLPLLLQQSIQLFTASVHQSFFLITNRFSHDIFAPKQTKNALIKNNKVTSALLSALVSKSST